MESGELERTVSAAFADRARLKEPATREAVEETIALLDTGRVRVAEKVDGVWRVNAWVKEAILLYFALRPLEPMEAGDLRFFDKIRTKTDLQAQGIRVVPPGVARYGSFLEPGCVVMPGLRQHRRVRRRRDDGGHLGHGRLVRADRRGSAPLRWRGDRRRAGAAGRVAGHHRGRRLHRLALHRGGGGGGGGGGGAGRQRGPDRLHPHRGRHRKRAGHHKGRVPARSVVIPGTLPKQFPAGTFHVPCALRIGERKPSTDKKTSLNDVLRIFDVQV
jgi:2,3,4,5-tetrahydropyridine-2-carboxylate N-succinyltransferase